MYRTALWQFIEDNQFILLPIKKEVQSKDIFINLAGDISFSREIANKINKYGVDYPFEKTKDILAEADITIGNLESPFTAGAPDISAGSMTFGAKIEAVKALQGAGFDAMNLANNHFSNQGKVGMLLTFDTLSSNNIGYFGAGRNFSEAHEPYIKKINDFRIAFLGYSDSDVLPANSIATETNPGLAVMDIEQLKIDVLNTKKQADLTLVSMHSGTEYTPYPNNRQKEFARAAIDAGADMVFGHHPHVVQGTEIYKDKTIIYSLGNFVFDQPWSRETQQGLIAKLKFTGKKLETMNLIPVRIYNWAQPTIITDEQELTEINNRILDSSNRLK